MHLIFGGNVCSAIRIVRNAVHPACEELEGFVELDLTGLAALQQGHLDNVPG
jgi:hypothetical protein